ncbi:protein of unknown function [Pseudomonas sp. JV551A1]|nr:protein of unknown function [Pseudomonas sp. JV551A1]
MACELDAKGPSAVPPGMIGPKQMQEQPCAAKRRAGGARSLPEQSFFLPNPSEKGRFACRKVIPECRVSHSTTGTMT